MMTTNATSPDGSPAEAAAPAQEALRRGRDGMPVWRWFDQRQRGHTAGPALGRPLEAAAGSALLDHRLAKPRDARRRVAYVHIPFCSKICTFCAFCRQASAGDHLVEAYVDALCGEIDHLRRTAWANARPFDAVYLGGGTPTTLSPPQTQRLLAKLSELPLTEDCEITVEGRVDGLERADVQRLVEAGVTRLSIGVQSFDTDVRRGVNRLADRDRVLRCLADAADAGIANLSVDLIYNLPGQSSATWARTLGTLARTPVTGCSVYALIPQPRSILGRQLARDQVQLAGLDAEYRYHCAAVDHFHHRPGWQRYSSVHYGRRDRETHRYNSVRGGDADVIGLGAGAGWRVGDLAGMNCTSASRFVARAATGDSTVEFFAQTPPAMQTYEALFNLVHGPGAGFEQFERLLPDWVDELEALVDLGLIRRDGDWCQLTDDGCFWAYNLAHLLGEAITQQADAER